MDIEKCEACGREDTELDTCSECQALTCDNCITIAEKQEVYCLYCWKEIPPKGQKK